MDAFDEVGLGDAVDFPVARKVDEMGDFHAVADGEGEGFEGAAARGVFAGERLEDAAEFRIEQRDQRTDEDFGNPAAAGRVGFVAVGERALVEGLDVVDFRIGQQRADEAGDESGVEAGNVAVDITDDVAAGDVQGFPEVFALSVIGCLVRKDSG